MQWLTSWQIYYSWQVCKQSGQQCWCPLLTKQLCQCRLDAWNRAWHKTIQPIASYGEIQHNPTPVFNSTRNLYWIMIVIGVYCIYSMLPSTYLYLSYCAEQLAWNTYLEILSILRGGKSDFISWQKMSVDRYDHHVITWTDGQSEFISLTVYYWVFLSLNNQTKQKYDTEKAITPFRLWLAALSVKYENKKPTQTVILHSTIST